MNICRDTLINELLELDGITLLDIITTLQKCNWASETGWYSELTTASIVFEELDPDLAKNIAKSLETIELLTMLLGKFVATRGKAYREAEERLLINKGE